MKKRIIFRADGNSTTGLGHLYRLFSLAELIKSRYEFVFITKESSTHNIIPKNFRKILISDLVNIEKEPTWLAQNFSPKDHVIIADGYQFIASYQKKIKEKSFKLIYIDDLAKEHMFADIVINHSPYLTKNHFKKEDYTQLALGTKYALLRPSFLEAAKYNRNIQNIDSVFVCFGGADPHNLTRKAVKALLEIDEIKKISVILGAAYRFQDFVGHKKENTSRVEVYSNLEEKKLAEVIKNSNFAIVPASTILYEVCCLKMPVLSGFYVDNQELIYKGFLERKAIYTGGNFSKYKKNDFLKVINEILSDNDYEKFVKAQKKLFDNNIGRRQLNLINQLCLH